MKFIDKWRLEFLIKNILMNNGCPLCICRQLSPGRGLVWRVVWVWGPGHNFHHLQLFRGQYPTQGSLCEKDQTLQLPIHLSKSQRRWELIKNAAVIRICWHWKEVCSVFYGQHLQQYYKKCVANKIWLGQQFLKYLSFRELNSFPWGLDLSQEEFSNETFLWNESLMKQNVLLFSFTFHPTISLFIPQLNIKEDPGSISVLLSSRNNDGISKSFNYITGNCYRCLSIHQKHGNVLQYKESRCMLDYHSRNYHELCWSISVDEPLKTMFRVNGNGVSCPITGTFSFSYSRGHGLCNYPLSSLHQCAGKCHPHFVFCRTNKSFWSVNCTTVLYHISLYTKKYLI